MKKLFLAAGLILSAAAFAQTPTGNNHGQNDCQCIGIGIETKNPKADKMTLTPQSILRTEKQTDVQDLWYRFMKQYLGHLLNTPYKPEGK